MQRAGLNRVRQIATFSPRRNAMATLRLAFFGQACESANRYHVHFERVLAHLWTARSANRRLWLRSVTYLDDLVHAIACVDKVGLAWADLAERYERPLIRRCRGLDDEITATIFVRRLFAELRRRNDGLCLAQQPSLRCYSGMRPLRNWLADRLSAARARQVSVASPRWSYAPFNSRPFSHAAASGCGMLDRSACSIPLRFVEAPVIGRSPAIVDRAAALLAE